MEGAGEPDVPEPTEEEFSTTRPGRAGINFTTNTQRH